MQKTNRELNGLDWQENADGSWVAVTKNYKCVALPKLPEEISTSEHLSQYTYEAVLYQWSEAEDVWVLLERTLFGSKGAQDAKFDAERLLGSALRKAEQKTDPATELGERLQNEMLMRMLMSSLGGPDEGPKLSRPPSSYDAPFRPPR